MDDDMDAQIDALLDELGIVDPTANDLWGLAEALVRDALELEGGKAAAERLAAALRRRALQLRNQR